MRAIAGRRSARRMSKMPLWTGYGETILKGPRIVIRKQPQDAVRPYRRCEIGPADIARPLPTGPPNRGETADHFSQIPPCGAGTTPVRLSERGLVALRDRQSVVQRAQSLPRKFVVRRFVFE